MYLGEQSTEIGWIYHRPLDYNDKHLRLVFLHPKLYGRTQMDGSTPCIEQSRDCAKQ